MSISICFAISCTVFCVVLIWYGLHFDGNALTKQDMCNFAYIIAGISLVFACCFFSYHLGSVVNKNAEGKQVIENAVITEESK